MNEINYELIGQKMKKLRKEQGITQEKIAEDLNTTVSFVSNIENNHTKINLRVLSYYSKLLNVSVDYFLGNDNPHEISHLDREIIRLLNDFFPEEKQKFIRILKIIKE